MGASGYKELTYEERKKIRQYLSWGYSCGAISKMLGRGKNTIVTEVRRNGGSDDYTAKKAQERYKQGKKSRSEKLKASYAANPRSRVGLWHIKFEQELELIKTQLDIIQEALTRIMEVNNGEKD